MMMKKFLSRVSLRLRPPKWSSKLSMFRSKSAVKLKRCGSVHRSCASLDSGVLVDSRSNSSAATSPVFAGAEEDARVPPVQNQQADLGQSDWVPLQLDLCREVAQEIGKCPDMGWLASAVSADCLAYYGEDSDTLSLNGHTTEAESNESDSEAIDNARLCTPLTSSTSSPAFFTERSSLDASDCDESTVESMIGTGVTVDSSDSDNVVTVTCGSGRCVSVVPITMTSSLELPDLAVTSTAPQEAAVACDVLGTVVLHVSTLEQKSTQQTSDMRDAVSLPPSSDGSDSPLPSASSVNQCAESVTCYSLSTNHQASSDSAVSLNDGLHLLDQVSSLIVSPLTLDNTTVVSKDTVGDDSTSNSCDLDASGPGSHISELAEVLPVTSESSTLEPSGDVPSPSDITAGSSDADAGTKDCQSPSASQQPDTCRDADSGVDAAKPNGECDGKDNNTDVIAITPVLSTCESIGAAEMLGSQLAHKERTDSSEQDETPKPSNPAKSKIAVKNRKLIDRSSSNDIERNVSRSLWVEKSLSASNSAHCKSATPGDKKLVKSVSYDRIPKVTVRHRATSIACALDKLTTCNYAKTCAPVAAPAKGDPPTRPWTKTRSSHLSGKSSCPASFSSNSTDKHLAASRSTAASSATLPNRPPNKRYGVRDNTRTSLDTPLRHPPVSSAYVPARTSPGASGGMQQNSSCRVVSMVRKPCSRPASLTQFSSQSLSRLPTPVSLPASHSRLRQPSGNSRRTPDSNKLAQLRSERSGNTSIDGSAPNAATVSLTSPRTSASIPQAATPSATALSQVSDLASLFPSSTTSPRNKPSSVRAPCRAAGQQRSAVPKATRAKNLAAKHQ